MCAIETLQDNKMRITTCLFVYLLAMKDIDLKEPGLVSNLFS